MAHFDYYLQLKHCKLYCFMMANQFKYTIQYAFGQVL
jgi:hypothetical protein